MKSDTENLYSLMKEKFGSDLSVYDQNYLRKTIETRMNALRCATDEKYFTLVSEYPDEFAHLIHELGNSYSEFFRNSLTFSLIEQLVIPKLSDFQLKKNRDEIRIWSAGCASGQEPYSLAMLFDNYSKAHKFSANYRIFATDISENELFKARKGVYDFNALRNIRLGFSETYFKRKGDTYILDSAIKEKVDFSVYDLLDKKSSSPSSAIYGDFDVIMCSNVMFYYEPEYQQLILEKFYRSLKPGGFFITGEAETHIVKTLGSFKQYGMPAPVFVKS